MLVKSREAYCMIHTCEHVSKDQNQLLLQSAVCESLTASTIIWLAFITMVNYKTLITKWILLIFNPFQISDLDFRLVGDYVFSMLGSNFYQIIHFLCAIQNLQSEKLSENHGDLDRGPRGLKHKNFHLVTSIKNFNEIKKCFD